MPQLQQLFVLVAVSFLDRNIMSSRLAFCLQHELFVVDPLSCFFVVHAFEVEQGPAFTWDLHRRFSAGVLDLDHVGTLFDTAASFKDWAFRQDIFRDDPSVLQNFG